MSALDRARARTVRREVGRLGALLAEIDGTGPAVQPLVTEPGAVDEVGRLVHVFEHGSEPLDVDECTDDEFEVERLLDVAAEGG